MATVIAHRILEHRQAPHGHYSFLEAIIRLAETLSRRTLRIGREAYTAPRLLTTSSPHIARLTDYTSQLSLTLPDPAQRELSGVQGAQQIYSVEKDPYSEVLFHRGHPTGGDLMRRVCAGSAARRALGSLQFASHASTSSTDTSLVLSRWLTPTLSRSSPTDHNLEDQWHSSDTFTCNTLFQKRTMIYRVPWIFFSEKCVAFGRDSALKRCPLS